MGSGASKQDVDQHLRKWESAVEDLSKLCVEQRKALNVSTGSTASGAPMDRSPTASSRLERKGSSGVAFLPASNEGPRVTLTPNQPNLPSPGPDSEVTMGASGRMRRTSSVSFEAGQGAAIMLEGSASVRVADAAGVVTPPSPGLNPARPIPRQRALDIRKERNDLYASYAGEPEGETLACSHFGAVAAGLSYLLGVGQDSSDKKNKVTVENLFFAAHVPLHFAHKSQICLSELYDIVREFIDVDSRFKGQFLCEVLHMDVSPTVGEVEIGSNETGDRQAKLLQPELRRVLQDEIQGTDSVRFVLYDPFVVEQALLVEQEGEDEGGEGKEEEPGTVGTLLVSPSHNIQAQPALKHQKENDGQCAVVTDVKLAVQHIVSLTTAKVADNIYTEVVDVPVNVLYKAIRNHDPVNHRSRGYVRVWRRTSEDEDAAAKQREQEEVDFWFSPELCSGKVIGSLSKGIHAHAVLPFIAPHLAAVAFALHLIQGPRGNGNEHGCGLPISDIVRKLHLPIDAYVDCDLSLDQVYLYAQAYLETAGMDHAYKFALHPVLTKVSRDDAVPTLSIIQMEDILKEVSSMNGDPEAPRSIMIVQFNADIAHNVLQIATSSQWGIVAGYNDETQEVRILDANAKRFCGTWTCGVDRFHKAITNYGYILLTVGRHSEGRGLSVSGASQLSAGSEPEAGTLHSTSSTVMKRLDQVEKTAFQLTRAPAVHTFTFPSVPFPVTQLAAALTYLGRHTTVDDILLNTTFEINSLLSPRISLEGMSVILHDFLKKIGENANYFVTAKHLDVDSTAKDSYKLHTFVTDIQEALAEKSAVLVNFRPDVLLVFGTQHPVGEYGILTQYNSQDGSVAVSDVNQNGFLRTWVVSAASLFQAMMAPHGNGERACGFMTLGKRQTPVDDEIGTVKIDLAKAPLQTAMTVSTCPQLQGMSIAFAQLGYEFSAEELFYEAYMKTVSEQRRRGSQANAWRDVGDVSLTQVNKKINVRFLKDVMKKFLDSRKLKTLAVTQMDDVTEDDVSQVLTEAVKSSADYLVVVLYKTEVVHGFDHGCGTGIVQGFDADTGTVTIADADFCMFGASWFCPLEIFVKAADLSEDGLTNYGLLKVARTSGEDEPPLTGFSAFGGGGGAFGGDGGAFGGGDGGGGLDAGSRSGSIGGNASGGGNSNGGGRSRAVKLVSP